MQLPTILEDLDDLPPTPQILPRLQKLLRDPNADQSDLVSLLKVDSALTARIIRLANSAYYGARQPSGTLSEAVSRLGFREVYRVTSLAISSNVLGGALPAYHLEAGELFERSLACATLLAELPESTKDPVDAETRYTVGLLHSVGKIVVNHFFLQRGMEVYSDNPDDEMTPEEERSLLGFDHAEAGAAALRKWHFPDNICEAIGYQLTPLKLPGSSTLAAQLTLARWALPFVRKTHRVGRAIPVFEGPEILEHADISPEELTLAMRQAQEAFIQAQTMMRAH